MPRYGEDIRGVRWLFLRRVPASLSRHCCLTREDLETDIFPTRGVYELGTPRREIFFPLFSRENSL